ncbi:25S rRNA (adenine645-N1)-methyltransferase [Tulasnella sp. 418]|nr:25S rRNA (adenine645-N1)-methyltransferase [Tulasnella sp. 418]
MSFDLVSNNDYVVAADICEKVPLPGGDEGGKIVDLVLCSLSLMSTNWLGCIKEAKRILTDSGHLWIAEVTSRFKNVDTFVSVVSSLGFDLVSKEEPNTHFILFSFRSIPRGISKSKSKEWKALVKRSEGLLKPCEYKRR